MVELESIAEFPEEMESFRSVLLHVDEYEGAIRLEVTALGTTWHALLTLPPLATRIRAPLLTSLHVCHVAGTMPPASS